MNAGGVSVVQEVEVEVRRGFTVTTKEAVREQAHLIIGQVGALPLPVGSTAGSPIEFKITETRSRFVLTAKGSDYYVSNFLQMAEAAGWRPKGPFSISEVVQVRPLFQQSYAAPGALRYQDYNYTPAIESGGRGRNMFARHSSRATRRLSNARRVGSVTAFSRVLGNGRRGSLMGAIGAYAKPYGSNAARAAAEQLHRNAVANEVANAVANL